MSDPTFLAIAAITALSFLASFADANDGLPDAVRSVLEHRCLKCHNDDDLKGDFSLQSAAKLKASGHVEPGKASDSPLYQVLVAPAGQRPKMPPQGEPLSPAEAEAVRRWIQAGAAWPEAAVLKEPVVNRFDWWSLQPLSRPRLPAVSVKDSSWVRNPVDAYIIHNLRAAGLAPAPEADRRTLVRRLSYDLTGLPPTPEEIDAFVADSNPLAYENLVDRLLASPHAGEHWARHWLDVVRYADTCGYDKDKLRPNAWPYRDYVIRAFNTDKPYSRFIEEQIAGDAIFPGTSDGILGLGFIAAGPWDFIGHVEVSEAKLDGQEARNLDRDEMVSATLNTFCSTTVQCARCHHHKFDPISQEQYYGLQAVFAAVDRADRVYDTDPTIESRRKDIDRQLASVTASLKSLVEEIRALSGGRVTELESRLSDLKSRLAPVHKPEAFGAHSALAKQPDAPKWFQFDLGDPVAVSRIILRPCHDDFAGIGPGFGFPIRYRIEAADAPEDFAGSDRSRIRVLAETKHDVPNPGLAAVEIPLESPATIRVLRVTATRLHPRQNDYAFALAEIEVRDTDGQSAALSITPTSGDSIEAPPRWTLKNLTDGLWPKAPRGTALDDWRALQEELATLNAQAETPDRIARREQLTAEQKKLEKERADLPAGQLVYAAATEFRPQSQFKPTNGTPRPVHVLHRGNLTQPRGDAVPGTIGIAPESAWRFALPESHSEGDRRAALATWISDRDNPLTWRRSIANRLWQFSMGKGLVDSPNDFGRMGQLPTHPELLDWLAVEFRDNGQSFRSLIRLIVTSSAYRQASVASEDAERIDRSNQWLWRRERRRLTAEEIRDSMLAVSGRLDRSLGGPAFQAFVLEKPEHSPHYEYHQFDPADPKSHRRSVYRFVVRSQPDPLMTVLDCADSSQSMPRREETLTALQALSLLNSRFTLQMATDFAARLERESPDLTTQVNRGFSLVTGREPTASERRPLEDYARQHGLASLCRVLLNLSEFLYVD